MAFLMSGRFTAIRVRRDYIWGFRLTIRGRRKENFSPATSLLISLSRSFSILKDLLHHTRKISVLLIALPLLGRYRSSRLARFWCSR